MKHRSTAPAAPRTSPHARRFLGRLLTALVVIATLATSAGIAAADDVTNGLDNTVDAAVETMSLTAGGSSGTTTIRVLATGSNNSTDPNNGCNFGGNSGGALTIALASSNTGVATVSPAQMTFTSCDNPQSLTITPVGGGTASISATEVSETAQGTFNLAPVTFTVNVAAAPTVSVAAPDASGTQGQRLTTGGTFADANGVGTLTVVKRSADPGTISYNNTTGAWSWEYTPAAAGSGTVVVTATDNTNRSVTDTFEWTAAPAIAGTAFSAVSGSGSYGGTGTLTATLRAGTTALQGRTVSFALDGNSAGTATTDANGVATVTGVNLGGRNAGTHTGVVSASFAGDSTHGTSSGTGNLVVTKTAQTITFTAPTGKTFGDAPFALDATASSGLPVTLSVDSGPCTVNNGMLTINGAGSCDVTAAQAGNANLDAASNVTRSIQIAKADQVLTLTFDPETATFGDGPVTVAASSSSGLSVTVSVTDGPCTLSGTSLTLTGAGGCDVTASQAGNADYNSAGLDRTLDIAKAAQTISFTAPTGKTFGDAPFALGATASSGLAVAYAVTGPCSVEGDTVTITGAGSCEVTASQPGNSDFNAASDVTETLQIAKASQTITFAQPDAKTYGDAPFALSASATSGLDVSFARDSGPCTVTNGTVTITGAGDCVVTASQGGDDDYNAATTVQQTITIAKASQIITFAQPDAKTYGDAPFALNASATSGLDVTYTVDSGPCTVTEGVLVIDGAGSCDVTAAQGGNGDYDPAGSVTRTVTIARAGQSISFAQPAAKTFGDAPFALGATAGSGLPVSYTVDSGPCTVNNGMLTINGAGSCDVTAAQAGDGNYRAATAVQRTVTIAKANQALLEVTVSPASGYLGDRLTLGATGGTGTGLVTYDVSGTACRLDAGKLLITAGSGTCSVTATKASDADYNAATSAAGTITPTAWTVRGFYAPVDLDGVWNTVKGGGTVPLKFEVFAGSTEFTSTSAIGAAFSARAITCPNGTTTTDAIEVLSTGGTSLRYDATAGQFIQNWATPKKPGTCWALTMTAADGTRTATANFMLK